MPRCARERKPDSVYHVKQTCSSGACLFASENENLQFLDVLKQLKSNCNFRLYGVLLEPGSFELLICPEYVNISNIMRSLMIQYANIKQLETPLCKERYKSTCITEKGEFIETLDSFRRNKALDLPELINHGAAILDISIDLYNTIIHNPEAPLRQDILWLKSPLRIFSTVCCINSIEQGKDALETKMKELQIPVDQLRKHKELRNKLTKWYRQNSTLSLKEIGVVLGNISESTVSKILKSNPKEKR